MKIWLIIVLTILLFLIGSIYVFIPNNISINHSLFIKVNREGIYRNMIIEKNWSKWWPGNISYTNMKQNLFYNNSLYSIDKKTFVSLLISITHGSLKANTSFDLIAKNIDSVNLTWEGTVPTSEQPFKRLQIYLKAKQINNDIKTILKKIQDFFSKTENVYGYNIRHELVTDSILVSTYGISKNYPSTNLIYGLIDQLKIYTASRSAKETGFPMLNINTKDSINYLTRVAIPVNKKLPSSGNISYKWMLGGGNILVMDVKGGPSSIKNAFNQMENYVNDYQKVAPAIPFQSLITDRRQEPDTSKWVTRIYYPVM